MIAKWCPPCPGVMAGVMTSLASTDVFLNHHGSEPHNHESVSGLEGMVDTTTSSTISTTTTTPTRASNSNLFWSSSVGWIFDK